MKIVKIILVVIAVLIAIPLVAALFIKKEYAIEREITINRPKEQVFEYVKHIKNQANYNKWTMQDPGMKKEFKGTDGTVGFYGNWDSKSMGKGEQEILQIREGERIDIGLHFIKPFEGKARAHMITETLAAGQTKVKWGMQGKSKYPMNVMNIFMNNMLGKDIEISLATLKNVLEKSDYSIKKN